MDQQLPHPEADVASPPPTQGSPKGGDLLQKVPEVFFSKTTRKDSIQPGPRRTGRYILPGGPQKLEK
jgi:hypothetical protein